MKNLKLKKNNIYRHVFKPNVTYYYDINEFNIHNNVLYSHIIYKRNDKEKGSYIMAFIEYNFDRCFTNIIKERKTKLKQLLNDNKE
jgi:hypothetical protein